MCYKMIFLHRTEIEVTNNVYNKEMYLIDRAISSLSNKYNNVVIEILVYR